MTDTLVTDKQTITSIYLGLGDMPGFVVGDERGITKIVVYEEKGQEAFVPWFKVYVGSLVRWRVNAAFVAQVGYAPEKAEEGSK